MARRLELDRAVDDFLDHVKVERGLSPNTIDGYARDLARLGRSLDAARPALRRRGHARST